MPTHLRMFAAVVPPDHAVEHLAAFLEPRRDAAAFRWASPEQFHVPVAFRAAVDARRLA